LGPGPRLLKKGFYRAAVSQRLRNTSLLDFWLRQLQTHTQWFVAWFI